MFIMLETIVFFLLLLLAFMFYWVRRIKAMKKELIKMNERLESKLEEKDDTINSLHEIYDDNVIASKTDLKGKITYASGAFCRTSEYTKEELIGQPHNIVKHPSVGKEIFDDLWESLNADKTWTGEMLNLSKNGKSYWVETIITPEYDISGKKIGYNSVRHDITAKKELEEVTHNLEEMVKERTRELQEISITDALTGLHNRRHFEEVLSNEFQRCKRIKANFIFSIFDIDMFKQYNDTYGHPMGDEVLVKITGILKEFTQRANDFAFRIGGEEFCVISSSMSKEDAQNYFEKLRASIEESQIEHIQNRASNYVTASFGLVVVDFNNMTKTVFDERYDSEKVHQFADKLLYKAKDSGRNNIQTATY